MALFTSQARTKHVSNSNVSVTASSDILTSALSPRNTAARFVVSVEAADVGVLSVRKTRGGTTYGQDLNAGESLEAGALEEFDFLVLEGDTINFQYSVNTTFNTFSVVEV